MRMSRTSLALTALALIAALIVVGMATPLAFAQVPQKYSRTLTTVAWEGSLLELYLNFSELASQYGLGPKGYEFAIAIPGTATPLGGKPLPILVSDVAGRYYCTLGYIILNIGETNKDYGLWMSSSLPYYFTTPQGNTYEIAVDPNTGLVAIYNATSGQLITDTKIYAYVNFPDKGSLEAAIKASPLNNGQVPPGPCQTLVEMCANGCYLRVYGVLIEPPRGLISGNKYSVLIKTTASPSWSFEAALYVAALNPEKQNILVNYDAGANYTIAFGRKERQTIPLVNGKLTVKGMVNVTINWTELRSIIENAYGESLSKYNISVLYRLYAPEAQTTIAEVGLYRTPNGYESNYTAPGSILADSNTEPLIKRVYGGDSGTWNITVDNNAYIIFNVTVDPNVTLKVVNKIFEVKYANLPTMMLPGEYGNASIAVRINETIYVGSAPRLYLNFDNVNLSAVPNDLVKKPFQFWALVAMLPLPNGLTILPGTLMAKGYMSVDTVNVFEPGLYGDNNVMNAFDAYYVVVTNPFSNNTKFFVGGKAYTIYGAESANTLTYNVTACAKLVSTDGSKIFDLWVNGTIMCKPIGNITYYEELSKYYGKLFFVYILPPRPYGGRMYYTVPMIAANMTTGTEVTKMVFALLPPVNTSNLNLGDDASLAGIGTVFRVRPWLAVYKFDISAGYAKLGNMAGTGDNAVWLGTWMLLYGVGFDLTDSKLTVWLGNYSISYAGLLTKITYTLLANYGTVVTPYNTTLAKDYGTFIIVVPLWIIKSTDMLRGATTGYIMVNVTGSGYNSDEYNNIIEIKAPDAPVVMIEPRPTVINTTTTDVTVENIQYPVWYPSAEINYSDVMKTPTAAYELYRSLGGPEDMLAFNATHTMIVVATPPAAKGTLYEINMTTTINGIGFRATLVTITGDELADGVYVNLNVSIPTLPCSDYSVMLCNVTAGSCSNEYSAVLYIKPSLVLHSKQYMSTAFSFEPYNLQGIVGEVLALPNDTVEIYGYGWGSGLTNEVVTVRFDTVPKIYTKPNEYGVWEGNYTVPPYKAGSIISVTAQSMCGEVNATIRVIQILHNGLRVTVSAWPVYYDDGSVKLPVVVTVTYYDAPATCGWPVNVEVMVYKDYSTTPQVYKLECKGDGVWYGVIDLGTVDKPTFLLLVAKAQYNMLGVTTLTGLATTGVTIDPELKSYAMNAVEAANKAAAEVGSIKDMVSNIDTIVKQMKTTLDAVNGKLDSITGKLDAVAGKLDNIASSLANIKDMMKTTAAEVMSKLDAIAADVAAVKKAVENLGTSITASIKEALANVATKEDVMSAANEVKNAVTSAISKAADSITAEMMKAKEDILAAINAVPGKVVEELGGMLDNLAKKIDDVKTAVDNLAGKVATKDDIAKVENSVKTAAEDIKSSISKLGESIKAVNSNIASLSKKIEDVKTMIGNIGNNVRQLKSSIDNVNTSTMIFGAATLVVSIIVLILLIIIAVKEGLLRSG